MITTNIIQRLIKIKNGQSICSGFTIEVDSKQYLISAKHPFIEPDKKIPVEKRKPFFAQFDKQMRPVIEIYKNNIWQKLVVRPIFAKDEIDVVVFPLEGFLTPVHELIPTSAEMYFSQDAYFLGFPYAQHTDSQELNNGFPFPFVKKGIISAIDLAKTKKIYVDGHNNKGFSGGPLVFIRLKDKKLCVAGVISGYITDQKEDRKLTELIDENSGIVVCLGIKCVTDLIKEFNHQNSKHNE